MHFFPMIIKSKYQKENLHKINKNKQMTKRNKIKDEKYNKMGGRIRVYLHNNAPTKIVISQQLQKHPQNKSLLTINIQKTKQRKRRENRDLLCLSPLTYIYRRYPNIYKKKKILQLFKKSSFPTCYYPYPAPTTPMFSHSQHNAKTLRKIQSTKIKQIQISLITISNNM